MADKNKEYIDVGYQKEFWKRIKNIPNQTIYTDLNTTAETIIGAINELEGELNDKQDKVDTRLDLVENITNVVDAINQNNSNTYDKGYEGGYRWDNYMTGSAANCGTDKDPLYNNNVYDIQGTRFDAATQILGADWVIPTTTQWQELIESTTITTVDYPYTMVKFTASNGNSISFICVSVESEDGYFEPSYSASEIQNASGFRERRNCIIDVAAMSLFPPGTPSWTITERLLSQPLYRCIGVVIRPVTKNTSLGVDLGLRSGTRWAATNLTMNGLAATNHDLGDHFAFGELIDKTNGQAPILHINNGSRHITDEERARWNAAAEASGDFSAKEDKTNKITAWCETPDNTHYPSEKLVKDSLTSLQNQINALVLGAKLSLTVSPTVGKKGESTTYKWTATFTGATPDNIKIFDNTGTQIAITTSATSVNTGNVSKTFTADTTYTATAEYMGMTFNASVKVTVKDLILYGFTTQSDTAHPTTKYGSAVSTAVGTRYQVTCGASSQVFKIYVPDGVTLPNGFTMGGAPASYTKAASKVTINGVQYTKYISDAVYNTGAVLDIKLT